MEIRKNKYEEIVKNIINAAEFKLFVRPKKDEVINNPEIISSDLKKDNDGEILNKNSEQDSKKDDSIKINDHFFMAKPTTFFKIASLYNNIPNIIETINNKLHPTTIITSSLFQILFLI